MLSSYNEVFSQTRQWTNHAKGLEEQKLKINRHLTRNFQLRSHFLLWHTLLFQTLFLIIKVFGEKFFFSCLELEINNDHRNVGINWNIILVVCFIIHFMKILKRIHENNLMIFHLLKYSKTEFPLFEVMQGS